MNHNQNIDIILMKLKEKVHKLEVGGRAEAFTDDLERKYGTGLAGSTSYTRNSEIDHDIQEALDKNGFKNCIISYRYDKKNEKYQLTKKSEEILEEFGGFKYKLS